MAATAACEKSCQADVFSGPEHASNTTVDSTAGGLPVLQTPFLTHKSGIEQIVECFCTGTAELKNLLLREVDTIFECKLCRSLFRGLPNLIKHKEIYCITPVSEPLDQSFESMKSTKELLEIVSPPSEKVDHVLKVEPIAGNQNAVIQYIVKKDLAPSSQSHHHKNTEESHVEEVDMQEGENLCPEDGGGNKRDKDGEMNAETDDHSSFKCMHCDRSYRVQGHLIRHMKTIHKTSDSSLNSSITPVSKKMSNGSINRASSLCSPSDSQSQTSPTENKPPFKGKFPQYFNFKAPFCKLCRRTFSSEQNLEKHIELHTDNSTDFYVKFYCCPLCMYKTRRKRDVVRHLSDFHKKTSSCLSRIVQLLESHAFKKPAEDVLTKDNEKPKLEEIQVKLASKSETPKNPLLKRATFLRNQSPRTDHYSLRKDGKIKSPKRSISKKPLHICNICGQSFTKNGYLRLHQRVHMKTAGIRTRSTALL